MPTTGQYELYLQSITMQLQAETLAKACKEYVSVYNQENGIRRTDHLEVLAVEIKTILDRLIATQEMDRKQLVGE